MPPGITTLNSQRNRQIAKNSAMLYMRMLLTVIVTLYTSRIVLNVLGVEDYGIYNVVGGFVAMMGFLNNSMATATQRFLSYEIGKDDNAQLLKVFNMSANIHFIIALFVLLIAETAGVWFLNTRLTIPEERMEAANWVFQFSLLAFVVNMLSVPFNAIIIAHEKMNVFALISLLDVGLKLFIVFMLGWSGHDKLKLYAVLMFMTALLIRIIYGIYCRKNFPESRFRYIWDRKMFKTLISFAGWNLWGSSAAVMYGQGVNVLLNIFFGPAVNAARGIAMQVRGAVNGFVQNFQMAINPQIIKSFAAEDLHYMHQLICQGAKYSFFLLYILSLPILLEAEIILRLWLKIVPEYSVIFTRLVVVNALIDSISGPLMTAAQASGKIRLYQGIVGGLLLMILPVSYLFLKLGFSPEITLYISIFMSSTALFARLKIIGPLVKLPLPDYGKSVILRILPVLLVSFIVPFLVSCAFPEGVCRLILIFICSLLSVTVTVYFIGLNRNEQKFLFEKARILLLRIKN